MTPVIKRDIKVGNKNVPTREISMGMNTLKGYVTLYVVVWIYIIAGC